MAVSHLRQGCAIAALALGMADCSSNAAPGAPPIIAGPDGEVDSGPLPGPDALEEDDEAAGAARAWAEWPMPNPIGLALPNEARYAVVAVGADEVVRDEVTGLVWQRSVVGGVVSQSQAQALCADLTLAGHRDWRLPSRVELVSLIDFTRSMELAPASPAIDLVAFPDTEGSWFWSSSARAQDPGSGWYVYFYFGYIDADAVRSSFNTRCVRAGARLSADGAGRYELQSDTVRDRGTGLTWQRAVSIDHYSFSAAKTYCDELNLGGGAGWRVPSMKELQTIVDEGRRGPALDPATFPELSSERFWTSSLFAADASLAWYVELEYGSGLYGLATNPYRVRCVR